MPIYDYVCTRCEQVTEVIHGIHAAAPRFCPACGAEGTLRKGITTSAVHFKGSGWAKKDRSASASSGKGRAAKPSGETAAAGGESAGGESAGGEPKGGDSVRPDDASPGRTARAPATAAATNGGD